METKKTKKEDVIRIINNAPVDLRKCNSTATSP
jgi:hypothetical protein